MANQEKKPRRSAGKSNRSLFRRTVFLMVCLGVLCFIPLVMQLWKLQVTEQDLWEERGANQQTKDVAVNANRGTIYDSAGNTLAMSATVYQLILSPRDVKASVNEEKYKVDGELDQAAYDQAVYEKRKLIVDGLVDLFGLDEERLWSRIEYTASAYEILAYELRRRTPPPSGSSSARTACPPCSTWCPPASGTIPRPPWAPMCWASWRTARPAAT